MISPQLGCDPKEVSPARAGAAFSEYAKKLATDRGIDFTQAWNQAKLLEPELHTRMCETTPAGASPLSNGGTPGPAQTDWLLANKPFIATAFHLPANVDNGVLTAAFKGNGNQFVKVSADKVFLAVQTYLMQKNGLTAAIAHGQMLADYPELALFAKQTPAPPAQAVGNFGIRFN